MSKLLRSKFRQNWERARTEALGALDRLVQQGTEGDMFTVTLGKDGKVYVKPYIRSDWQQP